MDPLVSVFPCATDPATVADVLLSTVLERIRSSELADICGRIRADFRAAGGGMDGKKAIAAAKRSLPGVCVAGTFEHRAKAGWRDPSGLIQFDLDDLPAERIADVRAQLEAAPYVAALWVSPSGVGLKGGIRAHGLGNIPSEDAYLINWKGATRWLASLGLTNDPQAKDSSRLAFLAHDPTAYFNPEAVPLDEQWMIEPQPPAAPSRPANTNGSHVEHVNGTAKVEALALAHVLAMPRSVEGRNGSAACMAVVRALRDGFALEDAAVRRVLAPWNRECATPAWSDAELEHKLESVRSTPPKGKRGWLVHPWPELVPLEPATPEGPAADLSKLLPDALEPMRQYLIQTAASIEAPVDMALMMSMSVASASVLKAVVFQGRPGHREPPPLFTMSVAAASTRKTATVEKVSQPLRSWYDHYLKSWTPRIRLHLDHVAVLEARISKARDSMVKAGSDERAGLASELAEMRAELEAMGTVHFPQFIAQDITPEALAQLLARNGERAALLGAEGSVVDVSLGRYSEGKPNLDILLQSWSAESFTQNRKNGPPVVLAAPELAIGIAIQHAVLAEITSSAQAVGRGLLARFLVCAPVFHGQRSYDNAAEVDPELAAWWRDRIGALCRLERPGEIVEDGDGALTRRGGGARVIPLNAKARQLYALAYDVIMEQLAPGGKLEDCGSWAGKLHGQLLRIAGILALLADPVVAEIDGASMESALHWWPYLVEHYRAAVVVPSESNPVVAMARKALDWIARRKLANFTHRDAVRVLHAQGFMAAEDWRPVFDLLTEHGYLRPISETQARGRPSLSYEVRPQSIGTSDSSGTSVTESLTRF